MGGWEVAGVQGCGGVRVRDRCCPSGIGRLQRHDQRLSDLATTAALRTPDEDAMLVKNPRHCISIVFIWGRPPRVCKGVALAFGAFRA